MVTELNEKLLRTNVARDINADIKHAADLDPADPGKREFLKYVLGVGVGVAIGYAIKDILTYVDLIRPVTETVTPTKTVTETQKSTVTVTQPTTVTETQKGTVTDTLTETVTATPRTVTQTVTQPTTVTETHKSTVTATVTKTVTATTTVTIPQVASVAIVRGASHVGPQALVEKALELLGGVEKLVPHGASVLVKPNVCGYAQDAVTDPQIAAAVVRTLKQARPTRLVVGDSSTRGTDTEHALQVTGIRSQAEAAGAEVKDLKQDSTVRVAVPKGRAINSVNIFQTVHDCSYLVNVPRLKRHGGTVTTIALKNMMGTVHDDEKGRFHDVDLSQCIADLNSAVRPNLVIVDAIQAMTETGPNWGTMVDLNLVIASLDPVAADVVASEELFKAEGMADPRSPISGIVHIQRAAALGVGIADHSKIQVLDVAIS